MSKRYLIVYEVRTERINGIGNIVIERASCVEDEYDIRLLEREIRERVEKKNLAIEDYNIAITNIQRLPI